MPAAPLSIRRTDGFIEIRNHGLAVRLPADGNWAPPFPGPFLGWSLDDGATWNGGGEVVGAPLRGRVDTIIESRAADPAGVQWRTEYRWGGQGGWRLRASWAAGSDTVRVEETATEDSAAFWTLRALDEPARAWGGGGGEHPGPMRRMSFAGDPAERRGVGARRLGSLAHIAYFGQWALPWAGLGAAGEAVAGGAAATTATAGGGAWLGIFSRSGGDWRRRGAVRPEVWEEDRDGAHWRFPVRAGRRLWGMVLTSREAARCDAAERCLLNARKIAHSDLAADKVARWQLELPVPARALRLLAEDEAAAFRAHRDDAGLRALAERLDGRRQGELGINGAARLLLGRPGDAAALAARWREWAAETWARLAAGGYEGIVIFEGRAAKRLAYELDWLWAAGGLPEADYAAIRRVLLALAYVYSDPDYCRYDDFRPGGGGDASVADALRDEMGDSPVPPNFAAEFFSTVGVVAELFPEHPEAERWRAFAAARAEEFLADWFAPEGVYRESINYHTHALAELGAYFHALRLGGGRDFYRHPAVEGSYDHFCRLLTPPLEMSEAVLALPENRDDDPAGDKSPLLLHPAPRRAYHPANGNSGGFGAQQEVREDLLVAAAAYDAIRPDLAGRLRRAWRLAGGPVFGTVAPLLALAALRRGAPEIDEPAVSSIREGLGLLSKGADADGAPRYALFRAGRATHHMDFDQGGLLIAAGARVLLGEHGYHTRDGERGLPAAATWLHSTVTYADDPELSSGYTGLEIAPDLRTSAMRPDFDYAVLEIVNHNFRRLGRLAYNQQIQAAPVRHARRYFFLKPNWWIVGDCFPGRPAEGFNPVCWLWPEDAPILAGDGSFVCGRPDSRGPALWGKWLAPETPATVFSRRVGPLHGWGVSGGAETGFLCALTLLDEGGAAPRAEWNPANRRLRLLDGRGTERTVIWPADEAWEREPALA